MHNETKKPTLLYSTYMAETLSPFGLFLSVFGRENRTRTFHPSVGFLFSNTALPKRIRSRGKSRRFVNLSHSQNGGSVHWPSFFISSAVANSTRRTCSHDQRFHEFPSLTLYHFTFFLVTVSIHITHEFIMIHSCPTILIEKV